ncbi:MAG: type II secretion system F family protein [Candidatus Omnitrophica bacterium]|nr:type II secretion system F family protein [Candidatus Omnitrophota bacterium]
MPNFNYTAKDRSGKTLKGDLEAQGKGQAVEILRSKQLMVLKLEEVKKPEGFAAIFRIKGGKKIKLDDLVILFRQLATMIESGIPVVNALDILIDQTDNITLKKVLTDVRDSVNTGSSLSDAFLKHSDVFTPLFVNMIDAGESSGMLDTILDRVATYIEKTNDLQKKVKSALMYPMIVSSMAVFITLVLMVKVIPVFKEIYVGFSAQLPLPTQILINISDILRNYFLIIIALVIAFIFWFRYYARTEKGMKKIDRLKLNIPLFGPLIRKFAISKFSRTLSTLVKSGVPILSALEIVAKTSGNVIIEKAIIDVRDKVRDGESIATPLEKSGVFPSMVTRMVSVGEKSGQLDKMLSKISDFYDSQVNAAVEGLTSMIEPLIIAFLGIVIGGIVMCMFLPIFQLSSVLGG